MFSIFVFFSRFERSFIWSTLVIHSFRVCCRLCKIAFSTYLSFKCDAINNCTYNKTDVSICLFTFYHFLASFLLVSSSISHPLTFFLSFSCSFFFSILFHSFSYLWQPPSLKMLTMHAEYMLCIILWHWMIDFPGLHAYRWFRFPFVGMCVRASVCVRVCECVCIMAFAIGFKVTFCNLHLFHSWISFIPFVPISGDDTYLISFWTCLCCVAGFSLVRLLNAKKRVSKSQATNAWVFTDGWFIFIFVIVDFRLFSMDYF